MVTFTVMSAFPVSGNYDTRNNATVDTAAVKREQGHDDVCRCCSSVILYLVLQVMEGEGQPGIHRYKGLSAFDSGFWVQQHGGAQQDSPGNFFLL